MRARKEDRGRQDRLILRAMSQDSHVLARIASRWRPEGLFPSAEANTLAGLLVRHHNKYGICPNGQIEDIVRDWAEERPREESAINLVERLADAVASDDRPPEAAEYALDAADRVFNRHLKQTAVDAASAALERGDDDSADRHLAELRPVAITASGGSDLLRDEDAIQAAFESQEKGLITYPFALGDFFGNELGRDCFVGIMGAAGRGKSWWLLELAWRAIRLGRRVAIFEVGDMSEVQIRRRYMVRATRHPRKAGKVIYPTGLRRVKGQDDPVLDSEDREYEEPLDWRRAVKECNRIMRGRRQAKAMIRVDPAGSVGVGSIESQVMQWASDGWVADVIAVDYADLLAPPSYVSRENARDGINAVWKELRAMSMRLHCLVLTATQTDAASYEAGLLRRRNFSEDRRKYDHVTGMVGINATEDEADRGLARLNWLKLREQKYSESRCVHVAGCLDLAMPAIRSCW